MGVPSFFGPCKSLEEVLLFLKMGGGGWGVHPDFLVKLDCEIAVDRQTMTHD